MSEAATVAAGTSSSEVPPQRPGPVPGRWVLFPLLVAMNGVAAFGQSYWLHDNVTDTTWDPRLRWGLAIGVALVLELLGVYLATMADQAEERNIPAAGIRTLSYTVGLFIGAQNFAHWAGVTFWASVIFGFVSSFSPFAWGIYARVRRARRVAPSRWFWHPIESIRLTRYAAWEGITDPEEARMAYEFRNTADDPRPTSGGGGRSMAEIGSEAIRLREEFPGRSWESIARELRVTDRHLRDCRKEAQA